MHEKDREWKLPLSDRKVEPISLSNGNVCKVVKSYVLLFDLVFENHPVGACVEKSRYCITYKFASVIENLRHRVNFTDDDSVGLQRKMTSL